MKRISVTVVALVALAIMGIMLLSAPAFATGGWDWGDGVRYRHISGPSGPHKEWIDSDGVVPVHRYCGWVNGKNAFTSVHTVRDGETGRIKRVEATMYINKCNLDFHNRSAAYREKSKQHELDHANGWDHWEGNPRVNAAYYP